MTIPFRPPGTLATWRDRLDPFAWCEVDRALVIVVVTLGFRLVNAAEASTSGSAAGSGSFIDAEVLARLAPALWGLVAWWGAMGLGGLWLRRAAPNSSPYVLLVTTSFWLTNAGVSATIGTFHSPFWIVLPGASVAMMLFFGWRRTLVALLPGLALIAAMTVAVSRGSLRYAPLFSRLPYDPEGRPELSWVFSINGASLAATLVTVLAAQLLLARLRAREDELRRLTRTDSLTEVGNRRAFVERLEQELLMKARRGGAIGVIVVDIDHFKRINDVHGHPVGDAALRAVSHSLVLAARQTDFVARIGGEEFALLLPATALEGTLVVAERCRIAIEQLAMTTSQGTPVPMTATFGASSVSDESSASAETLLHDADVALYQGKNSGRNRVVAANVDAALAPC